MFNIFTALFGGLYYGGKYISEKSKTKRADQETELLFRKMDSFKSKHSASYEMETQIKEYIMCGKNFEEICDTLSYELKDVLGKDWKNNLDIPNGYRVNYGCFYPEQHIYWVYHLLLSKKGKLDRWAINSGYSVSAINTRQRNIKFLQHIENNLRMCGSYVTLVYEENECMSYVKPDVMCTHSYRRLW